MWRCPGGGGGGQNKQTLSFDNDLVGLFTVRDDYHTRLSEPARIWSDSFQQVKWHGDWINEECDWFWLFWMGSKENRKRWLLFLAEMSGNWPFPLSTSNTFLSPSEIYDMEDGISTARCPVGLKCKWNSAECLRGIDLKSARDQVNLDERVEKRKAGNFNLRMCLV